MSRYLARCFCGNTMALSYAVYDGVSYTHTPGPDFPRCRYLHTVGIASVPQKVGVWKYLAEGGLPEDVSFGIWHPWWSSSNRAWKTDPGVCDIYTTTGCDIFTTTGCDIYTTAFGTEVEEPHQADHFGPEERYYGSQWGCKFSPEHLSLTKAPIISSLSQS